MAPQSAFPGAGPGAGAAADPKRWLVLGVICCAYLMVGLDLTVMSLALLSAREALGFSDNDRAWIVTAYALPFGSLLLFGGRLSDLIGRKQAFLIGLTGFAVASAIGGAATNFETLVAARAAQGAFAHRRGRVPPRRRTRTGGRAPSRCRRPRAGVDGRSSAVLPYQRGDARVRSRTYQRANQ